MVSFCRTVFLVAKPHLCASRPSVRSPSPLLDSGPGLVSLVLAACQVTTRHDVAFAGYTEMSEAFRSLENQYAVELVKEKRNEGLIERLLLGMHNLRAVAGPTGQCSDGTHFQILLRRLFVLTDRCMCETERLCMSACQPLFLLVLPPLVPDFLACRLEHPMETSSGCCR